MSVTALAVAPRTRYWQSPLIKACLYKVPTSLRASYTKHSIFALKIGPNYAPEPYYWVEELAYSVDAYIVYKDLLYNRANCVE
jgi:hypothetical protein